MTRSSRGAAAKILRGICFLSKNDPQIWNQHEKIYRMVYFLLKMVSSMRKSIFQEKSSFSWSNSLTSACEFVISIKNDPQIWTQLEKIYRMVYFLLKMMPSMRKLIFQEKIISFLIEIRDVGRWRWVFYQKMNCRSEISTKRYKEWYVLY